MKKMIRRIAVVLIGMVVLLGSCNKTDEVGEAVIISVDSIEEHSKVVDIRISFYGEGVGEIVEMFNEQHSDINVTYIQSNWRGHYDKLKAELAADAGPDVFLLDGVNVPQYSELGAIMDLTERINRVDTEAYLGFDQLVNPEGKIYGVPQGIQVDVLYYNKDMFDEVGLAYPTAQWTLNDLRRAAMTLTNEERYGFAMPIAIRYGYYPIIRQFGGDILDENRRNSTIASDPMVKEAVQFIYDAWNTDGYVPDAEAMAGELTSKSVTYFSRGKVAMYYDCYAQNARAIEGGINYDVVIQPMMNERYASFIANSWVINNDSTDAQKEAAWKFLEFYLQPEIQKMHADVFANSIPANKAVAQELIADTTSGPDNDQAFLETFEFAATLPESVVWSEQNRVFEAALTRYLNNEITIDEFIESADAGVQAVLDSFYTK